MKKRILSFAMALAMVVSILPLPALAAEGCANHPVHDESCGYVAAVEGQACGHQHSDACRVETVNCTHVHTAECYPDGNMDGEPTLCGHVCSEESGCVTVSCNHVHDGECGYVEAVAGQPCNHSCELCNPPEEPEEAPVCICDGKCNEMVNHDCPVCAVDAGQCAGNTPEEPAAQPVGPVVVTAWTWVDPEEYLEDGGLALPGASAENPASFETVVSMLPAAVMAVTAEGEISLPLTWACPEFPAQGAYQGTYLFTAALPEGYALAEGELTIPVDLGGVTTYEADPVAQVVASDGTRTTFDSLEGAVNSAQDGDAVELLTAASLGAHLSIDKNITLSVKAPLSIENGSITIGEGKSVIIDISTGCSITDIDPRAISIRVSGTLTVTGEGSINCFVRVMQPGKIERGTFSGSVNNMGTINAGLFNGSSDSTYVSNEGTINGGTFETIVYNDGTIKEGIFKEQVDFGRMTHRRGTVSGGQFALQPNANTPAGKKLANIGGQYPWRVVDADAVAAVSGQTYLSLAAAATAAQPGETITLLADAEVNDAYEVKLRNDLDLNGHDVTVNEVYGILINEGEKVTVSNGNILQGQDNLGYILMIRGEFTTTGSIEGGTFVDNGTLNGGTYTGLVKGPGTIKNGSFSGEVSSCTIFDGIFENEVYNGCTVNGGTFYSTVMLSTIKDGIFNSTVLLNTIDGGSFKYDPSEDNTISDGYQAVKVGEYYTVVPNDAVAAVGGKGYATLAAAAAAAQPGETITLLADAPVDRVFELKNDLDLNGCGITLNDAIAIPEGAAAKILGITEDGNISADDSIPIVVWGTLTASGQPLGCSVWVDGGEIAGGSYGDFVSCSGGKISGGSFTGSRVAMNTGTIEGGSFGENCAVEVMAGTIKSGEFNGSVSNSAGGFYTIEGGAFKGSVKSAAISGGDFTGTVTGSTLDGGHFKTAPTQGNTLGAGKMVVNMGADGGETPYWVVDEKYVARIGTTLYDSFTFAVDAINRMENGGTITLLKDVWPSDYRIYKNCVIVMDNGSIVGSIRDSQLLDGCNLTVEGTCKAQVRLSSHGTIEGGTFTMLISAQYAEEGFINGGTFDGPVNNITINGGFFNGTVSNSTISGGYFASELADTNKIADGFVKMATDKTYTDSEGNTKTYLFQVCPATCTLTVTAPAFDAVSFGYDRPEAKVISIANSGNSEAFIASVAVDAPAEASVKDPFEIDSGDTITVPADGANTNYTLRPKAGLAAGEYKATVTVTYKKYAAAPDSEDQTATAEVTFTVYKADPTVNAPTGLTATYGDTLADVALPEGWAWDDDTASVGNAGENTFSAAFTPSDTDNYNSVRAAVTVAVSKADPTVTVPTGLTATYGDTLADVALPEGWTWDNGTASVGNAGSNVFSVTFTPEDTTNYNTVTAEVMVTVNKATLTVTAEAKSKTYGDTDPELTYRANVEGVPFAGALARDLGENVGEYAITQGTLSAGGNYALTFVGAKLTVTPKSMTVTAENQTKVYGEADPELTWQAEGLVDGDEITVTLSRAEGEDVGEYSITGTVDAGDNYNVTFTGASLEITPKPVTVTANAQTKIYGSEDPQLSYTADVEDVPFTGELARAQGENVGGYAINQGTLTAGENYAITFVGAELTIGKKTLKVAAVDGSKVYGDADPELTYTIQGLAAGDEGKITVDLTRAPGENVGSYIIHSTVNDQTGNYEIDYLEGTFTITQASLAGAEISVTPDSFTYDGTEHEPDVAVKLDGQELILDTDYTVAYSGNVNAGTATIIITGKGNYAGTAKAEFTIEKALPTVNLPTLASVTYGVKLSGIKLPAGWIWADESIVPTVKNQGFLAYFAADEVNYDWTDVEGYDAENHRVSRTLPLTVKKADPNPTIPTGLTASTGQTLTDVKLPAGWKWNAPNTAVAETGEQKFPATFIPADTDNYNTLTVKLTVTVGEHLVKFDSKGGSSVPTQTVKNGEKAVKPTDPTREGYAFKGWYKDEDLKDAWKFEADKVTETMTLYAKWAKVYTYTLSYDANAGKATVTKMPEAETKESEDSTISFRVPFTKPKRSGYTFTGWNTQANGNGTKVKAGETIKLNGDLTLYAQWKKADTTNAKTGDYIMIAVGVLAVSGAALAGLLVYSKKKKK